MGEIFSRTKVMQKEIWLQIDEIFYVASELNGAERKQYLDSVCAGNEVLLSEVIELLEEHDRANSLLELSVFKAGLKIFNENNLKGLEGKSLGNYHIQKFIGRGGMGKFILLRIFGLVAG